MASRTSSEVGFFLKRVQETYLAVTRLNGSKRWWWQKGQGEIQVKVEWEGLVLSRALQMWGENWAWCSCEWGTTWRSDEVKPCLGSRTNGRGSYHMEIIVIWTYCATVTDKTEISDTIDRKKIMLQTQSSKVRQEDSKRPKIPFKRQKNGNNEWKN